MKKSKQLKNKDNFIRRFIAEEKYLQNPPLKTKKFIEFCEKRGIKTNEKELEFFEKEKLLFPIIRIDRPVCEEEQIKFIKEEDGKEYCRQADVGLQKGEREIKRYKVRFYPTCDLFKEYPIDSYYKDLLSNWLDSGNLFAPSTKSFQNWASFMGEELEHDKQKIVSFYSSFQIYWIEILKKSFSISLNFADDKTDAFLKNVREISDNKSFQEYFEFDKKKQKLRETYEKFNQFLQFLLCIQSVYYPYAKSGAKTIQISGDVKKWQNMKYSFNLKEELKKLNFKIEDVAYWYQILSEKTQDLLGIKRNDWVQLWKNISWNKKNMLVGSVRLGVEYLQWAVMLKRGIEEYLQREILDINEITNILSENVLKFNSLKMNQYGILLKSSGNSDEENNYYSNRYKRLFYLSNSFGLDYQPRVIVFVEGKTEEKIFSQAFEWCRGQKPENFGIEFVNLEGISQFFSPKLSIKNPQNNKYLKTLVSNFNHLISYNLNKWQIIPFFVGDSENNISHLLKKGISITFKGGHYPFPERWQFLWGVNNCNKPFKGKDLELANFCDSEIATVLAKILNKEVKVKEVKKIRDEGKGIKQIDAEVDSVKIEIAEKLFGNLFDKISKEKNKTILERPIFKVIVKIINTGILNHPPVDKQIEIGNKDIIEKILKTGKEEKGVNPF